jgi:hypothetical protein
METFEGRHKNVPDSTAPKSPPIAYNALCSERFQKNFEDARETAIGLLATRHLREFNAGDRNNAGDRKQNNGRIVRAGNLAVLLSCDAAACSF